MTRPSPFGHPFLLGFDEIEQALDRVAKAGSDGYPPYNIEQIAVDRLRITLAVAGFAMDDLQITQEDNQLVIRGRQKDDSEGRIFLHRGIAARDFEQRFQLANHVKVTAASFDNGMLTIELVREVPEAFKPRKIAIADAHVGDANGNGGNVQQLEQRNAA